MSEPADSHLPPSTFHLPPFTCHLSPWRRQAAALGLPVLDTLPDAVPPEVLALLPAGLAREHALLPLRVEAGALVLATAAPALAVERMGELEFAAGLPVSLVAAEPMALHALMARLLGGGNRFSMDASPEVLIVDPSLPADKLALLPPVARYVEHVLSQAVHEQASDIHFEPGADGVDVRLRVDGTLRCLPALPRQAGPAVLARLKVLAGLDTGRARSPQDGRIQFAGPGGTVDLRLATLPTVHGESAVIRVLDPRNALHTLASLGLPTTCQDALARATAGSGMVLATGPTGSGKTTTLYALLRALDTTRRKLLTIEDPVEYAIDGAVQVTTRPEIGLDFARALRSFLRHDPDIILVGEIRDVETARIAAQAALTGHLVTASLHCGSAHMAPLRLLELGLEPWLVAAALELALAQRLVRLTCPACAGAGCPQCGATGFAGRRAIYEWLPIGTRLREHIERGDLAAFAAAARTALPTTLATEGNRLVAQGLTTATELAAQLEIE